MIEFIKKLLSKPIGTLIPEEIFEPEEPNQNRGGDYRDLYIGKKIGRGDVRGEIVSINRKKGFKVKITKLTDPHFASYMDLGKTYQTYWHRHTGVDGFYVYEISPKHLKRRSSQLLLYCWPDTGWDWELDF